MNIPENLCILPFIHLSTKPTGQTRYCCFSPNHIIQDKNNNDLKFDSDINKIWNSKHARNFRKQFLNNERPIECKYCWKEESAGKKSKRIKELNNYKDKYIDRIKFAKNNNGYTDMPVYLDLRLGNKCNLKCRTCNSMFSSMIEREVKEWDNSFFAKQYQFKAKEDINKWYQSKQFLHNIEIIIPFLEHVYITGGEPSLIPELTKFLKMCIKHNKQEEILIRFNTNLAVYNKEFYNLLKQFKNVDIGPSIDVIGDKLTYMRHPLKWETFKKNYKHILNLPSHIGISVNCTVSIYNIFYLEELFNAIQDLSSDRKINFIFEIAHEPEYLHFNILTPELMVKTDLKIMELMTNNRINDNQYNDLKSISTILTNDIKNVEIKRKHFREYTKYIDKIRNENFAKTFPELKEMLNDN